MVLQKDDDEITENDFHDAILQGQHCDVPPKTLEDMRTSIVFHVIKKPDSDKITIEIDSKLDTSQIENYQKISLSPNNIPKELQKMSHIVLFLYRGVLLHECGHVVMTKKLDTEWNAFRLKHKQTKLASTIENIIEDSRVNYEMPRKGVVSDQMKLAMRLNGEQWLNGLIEKTEQEKKQLEASGEAWSGEPKNGVVISLMFVKGLYYRTLDGAFDEFVADYFPNASAKVLEDIENASMNIINARRFLIWPGGEHLGGVEWCAENLFTIVSKYAEQDRAGGGRGEGPNGPGKDEDGNKKSDRTSDGPMVDNKGNPETFGKVDGKYLPSKYPGGEMDGPLSEETVEALQESQDMQEKERQEKIPKKIPGKGKGGPSTAKAPTVKPWPPNPHDFELRTARLAEQIGKMKDMLKTQSKPIFVREQHRKAGRLMTPMLGKIMGAARRGEVSNIYTQTKVLHEKQDATLLLLIDVSGSTNIEMMKDAVTILAEAAGSWISDENFGIYTFGDNFVKVKDIDEEYASVRQRIGGIKWEGNTLIISALENMERTIKHIRRPGTKTLIIVTDFGFNDDRSIIREKLNAISEMNTILIGVCHFSGATTPGDLMPVRTYSQNFGDFTLIDFLKAEDLPNNFFDIYKKIAWDGMDAKEWNRKRKLIE